MVKATWWGVFAVAFVSLSLEVSTTPASEFHNVTFHISNETHPEQKHYALGLSIQMDWTKAYQMCRYHGMRLATIESKEDSDLLRKTVKNSGYYMRFFWTSGTDTSSEGYFYWMSTGKPLKYSAWNSGEPNNVNNAEHCVIVTIIDGGDPHWNDAPCNEKFYVLCEFFAHHDTVGADWTQFPILV